MKKIIIYMAVLLVLIVAAHFIIYPKHHEHLVTEKVSEIEKSASNTNVINLKIGSCYLTKDDNPFDLPTVFKIDNVGGDYILYSLYDVEHGAWYNRKYSEKYHMIIKLDTKEINCISLK